MKFRFTATVCLLGLAPMATSAWAQSGRPKVVYEVVEDVETQPFPVSRSEALVDELKTMIDSRERSTRRELSRRDDVDQYLGVMSYGGGTDRYRRPDPERFTKSLGEMRVAPESGGFGGWVARKLGMDTTPELPTFEEHLAGVGKVHSTFIAERGTVATTHNGVRIREAAERVALVIHAEADGRDYRSRLIHLTVDELAALAKDPKAALETDLGKLIRSVYQQQIVGEGRTDHTGIEPLVAVHAVTGPSTQHGQLVAVLPESLLARGTDLPIMSRDAMNLALARRSRTQFTRERLARIQREARERAAQGGDAKGLGGNLSGLGD